MKRYNGGDRVEPGIYFDPRRLVFRSLHEGGPLPGNPEDGLYAVPAVALFLLGPLVGLIYVIFLPLLGFVMLGSLVVGRISRILRGQVLRPEGDVEEAGENAARGPDRPRTVVARTVFLNAPVGEVYRRAHAPEAWDGWVAITDASDDEAGAVRLTLPGPLGDEVLQDEQTASAARWRTRCRSPLEVVTAGGRREVVTVEGQEDWSCLADEAGTRVSVTVEWDKPVGIDEATLAHLGSEALDRSLRRLEELCHPDGLAN